MRTRGFNLLELLVAIAISASIISAIVHSYGNLFAGYMFNNSKVEMQQALKLSMTMIKRDIQNAGVFGSFSFHNGTAAAYLNGTLAGSPTSDWCAFQNMGVGVVSFAAGTTLANPQVMGSTSEILRTQFGGNRIAYYNGRENGCAGGNISALNFTREVTAMVSAKTYMLASANRAYLLNFGTAQNNDALNLTATCNIAIVAADGAVMMVPDQLTMTVVPFITRYYYVATLSGKRGLYSVAYDGTNVTGPVLVSSLITNLSVSYLVDLAAAPTVNHSPTNNNQYRSCTTADMSTNGHNCFNQWGRIIAATVTLTAQSEQGTLSQSLTDTVGWLW